MIPPPPPLPSPTGPWYLSESAMSAATIVGPSSSHGGVAMQYNIMTYSLERNHCALPKTKKKKKENSLIFSMTVFILLISFLLIKFSPAISALRLWFFFFF